MWSTASTPSGVKPAARNRSASGHAWSFHHGSMRGLPLPTQGSTTIVRPPASTTSTCTRMPIVPSAPAIAGASQSMPCTRAASAPGKNSSTGIPSVCASTTAVTRTAPTWKLWVASPVSVMGLTVDRSV